MKLTVLVDNNTFIDEYYLAEPALSFYIECDNKKILFDVGYSDVFLKNAEKMGIDLNLCDYVVLSHGHNDHTGGLQYFNGECPIIAHPSCFHKKYVDDLYIGCPVAIADFKGSIKSIQLTEHLVYLGQIPRVTDFENTSLLGYECIDNEKKDDYLLDDTALVYQSDDGLFVITGCSHSGICNIIEYAKKVCNDNRIVGVIGGMHLFDVNDNTNKTIQYLNDCNILDVYPCHCVSLKVKAKMMQTMNVHEVGVGLQIIK